MFYGFLKYHSMQMNKALRVYENKRKPQKWPDMEMIEKMAFYSRYPNGSFE